MSGSIPGTAHSASSKGAARKSYLVDQMHRYVPVGRFHVYADHSMITTFRNLWAEQDEFLGDEGKAPARSSRLAPILPKSALRFIRAARLLLRYLRGRRSPSDRILELPVKGDFALMRRSGSFKVLNRERGCVYTLMLDPQQRAKLARRYELSRRVSRHAFAPRVEEVSLDEGYFAEEFLEGRHPTNFRGCFDGFHETYLPLLVDFAQAEPPKSVEIATYVESLRGDILDPAGLFGRLPPADQDRIRSRVEASCAVLDGEDGTVELSLSHGDFFSGNIVLSDKGARALDWAHLGARSPLHDLYYLVMNHCVRVMEPPDLYARFLEMLRAYRAELFRRAPDVFDRLEPSLSSRPEWRHLFYLECIQVPLERCDRPDDRYVASMLERVGWFDAFERDLDAGRGGAGSAHDA